MDFYAAYLARFEQMLTAYTVEQLTEAPAQLAEAMQYALLSPGKRLRPILCYATGHALGLKPQQLDNAAYAIEMLHSYSLVHDDLPAMDDDDLRRGLPTCHVKYDEATAILVGDGLQSLAFTALSQASTPAAPAEQQLKQLQILSHAAGASGMVGGQALDLAATGQPLTEQALSHMHQQKTGAIIQASVMLAAAVSQCSSQQNQALISYSQHIGLAFQMWDDVLDVEGNTATLGKQAGADAQLNKTTYATILGLEKTKQQALLLRDNAILTLRKAGLAATQLEQLAHFIVGRNH